MTIASLDNPADHADGWRGRASRLVTARRSLMVFADQGIVSAGNFLTGWLIARNLQPLAMVGYWGLFIQVVFYVTSLQQALVVYPLTVKGASQSKDDLSRLTAASLLYTVALAPLMLLIVGLAAAALQQSMMLGLLVGVAVVAWAFQETMRRALLAHLEYHRALVGDALRYLGQAAVILALAMTGRLSLGSIFAAILLTSLIAGVIQARQVRLRRPTVQQVKSGARDFWRLGRWTLAAAALGIVTSLALPYSLKLAHSDGDTQLAVFTAFGSIMAFVNPVMQSIVGLMLPACAQAMAAGGVRAAARAGLKAAGLGAAILGPILMLFLAFPYRSAHLMLKQPEYLDYYWALRWCVLGQIVLYIGAVIEAFLNSLQKAHSTFVAYLANTAAVLLIGLPLTIIDGLRGALIGLMLCAGVRVLVTLCFVRGLSWSAHPVASSLSRSGRTLEDQ